MSRPDNHVANVWAGVDKEGDPVTDVFFHVDDAESAALRNEDAVALKEYELIETGRIERLDDPMVVEVDL